MAAATFDIQYTDPRDKKSSGLRLFYAIPHIVITSALNSFSQALSVIQWFIILFAGKRNQGLWNLARGVLDWENRAGAYLGLMYDTYPNFGFENKDEPVEFAVEYEEAANRLTCAFRIIWAIPALIIAIGLAVAGIIVTLICWFAILFTGTQPRGMFDFLMKVHRYLVRTSAYITLLTDTYPKYE